MNAKKRPLYRVIYEEQRAKVLDGSYPQGGRLPYERELCQHYGVDRVTVRRAMQMLVEDGLIEKRTGVGSFVLPRGQQPERPEPPAPKPNMGRRFLYVLPVSSLYIETNPESYNAELFYFLQQECSKVGCTLVYMIENDPHLGTMAAGDYDGCFIVSRVRRTVVAGIAALMPVVCINTILPEFSSVLVEDENGAHLAVKYLISQGHRRIAMVGNSLELYTTGLRARGYRRAMRDAGLEVDHRYMAYLEDERINTARCIEQIFASLPQEQWPTAFFFHSDLLAVSAISVLMRRGILVPEDVSVVGFNNNAISENVYPRLSTVDTQRDLLAFEALQLMQRLLKDPDMRRIMVSVPARLVARDSVAPALP